MTPEMKLSVAGLLPDDLGINDASKTPPHIYWRESGMLVAEFEWLHVCWLAERARITTIDQQATYIRHLRDLAFDPAYCRADGWGVFASAEQRLEALCRTLWPEGFVE